MTWVSKNDRTCWTTAFYTSFRTAEGQRKRNSRSTVKSTRITTFTELLTRALRVFRGEPRRKTKKERNSDRSAILIGVFNRFRLHVWPIPVVRPKPHEPQHSRTTRIRYPQTLRRQRITNQQRSLVFEVLKGFFSAWLGVRRAHKVGATTLAHIRHVQQMLWMNIHCLNSERKPSSNPLKIAIEKGPPKPPHLSPPS